jgi:hypothetical protein
VRNALNQCRTLCNGNVNAHIARVKTDLAELELNAKSNVAIASDEL